MPRLNMVIVYCLNVRYLPVTENDWKLAAPQVSFREDDSAPAEGGGGAHGGLAEGEEIMQEAIAEEEASRA